MTIIPKLTQGEPACAGGDNYIIPVLLELKDGGTVVFAQTILVKHSGQSTVAESLGADEVKHDIQQAINSYFRKESIKSQATEITNALGVLESKLEIPK